MSNPTETPIENPLGAIIFFSYIVAALGLISLISYDLCKAYKIYPHPSVQAEALINTNLILTFASLAAISFSVLSYHMLNVLIYSYLAWADSANTLLLQPSSSYGNMLNNISNLHIWTWAKSSTLFKDFAENICNDPVRFWWTQQALSLSIGWNTFMAIEGKHVTQSLDISLIK